VKTAQLLIKTPEGIVFSQWLAGPVTRFLAWLIDLLVIAIVTFTFAQIVQIIGLVSGDLAGTALTLGYFAISIGYGIFLEWAWRGQTIGKKLFRLRVMDAEGMRLQFDQVVMRNLLRFVDMLPAFYFVGGLVCWLNRKCQRLGDVAANTVVVRTPQISEPDLSQILSGKFNSLRQYPHLVARLRQRVSPGEATTALQALIRREQFELSDRIDLFEQLAAHFRTKVNFPDEAVDGVPAEQYVRNVVDVIYRSR
jgi:uncharacterized RDD family membrane protein YckC